MCARVCVCVLRTHTQSIVLGQPYRRSANAETPKPVRLIVFKNRAGIILSVSTLFKSIGAETPDILVNVPSPTAASPWLALLLIGFTSGYGNVSGTGGAVAGAWVENAKSSGDRIFRTSVIVPLIAAAAAIAGDIRWVLPPGPCLPWKFRFEVAAHRSPGLSLSGFMAKHMEQPGSLNSNPASTKILSRPSASARCFTKPDPGTISARTPSATLLPFATVAAARMSSILEFVHEPLQEREERKYKGRKKKKGVWVGAGHRKCACKCKLE